MTKPTLLFITPYLPAISDSGGTQATQERLDELSKHFSTTVLARAADEAAIGSFKQKYPNVELRLGGELRNRTVINWFKSLCSGLPLSIWRNSSKAFVAESKKLSERSFDLVYSDHWLMWHAARHIKHARFKILNLHNAEHLIFERAAAQSNGPRSWVMKIEGWRTRQYLGDICNEADETHCLSKDDEAELKALCSPQSVFHTFLPAATIASHRYGAFSKSLLFVGTMSWDSNADGIRWFGEHVAPLLPNTYQTQVIGGMIHPDLPASQQPCAGPLTWHGRVPSIDPYYQNAGVFIAPLLYGSGIKIKVINALSHGLPVVTTSIGAEGFPDQGGAAVQVADTPEAFANAIRQLCEDESFWETAASSAQPYIQSHFSSQHFKTWTTQKASACQAPSISQV